VEQPLAIIKTPWFRFSLVERATISPDILHLTGCGGRSIKKRFIAGDKIVEKISAANCTINGSLNVYTLCHIETLKMLLGLYK